MDGNLHAAHCMRCTPDVVFCDAQWWVWTNPETKTELMMLGGAGTINTPLFGTRSLFVTNAPLACRVKAHRMEIFWMTRINSISGVCSVLQCVEVSPNALALAGIWT